jgi:hypothetical protein
METQRATVYKESARASKSKGDRRELKKRFVHQVAHAAAAMDARGLTVVRQGKYTVLQHRRQRILEFLGGETSTSLVATLCQQ